MCLFFEGIFLFYFRPQSFSLIYEINSECVVDVQLAKGEPYDLERIALSVQCFVKLLWITISSYVFYREYCFLPSRFYHVLRCVY